MNVEEQIEQLYLDIHKHQRILEELESYLQTCLKVRKLLRIQKDFRELGEQLELASD